MNPQHHDHDPKATFLVKRGGNHATIRDYHYHGDSARLAAIERFFSGFFSFCGGESSSIRIIHSIASPHTPSTD